MKGIDLGHWNTLTVVRKVDFGMYLDGGDEGDILLPTRYVPEGCKVGDEIDVFIYLDQDERPVGTTLTPKAEVGQFAYLPVAWVNQYGAFLDWGLMKDLFVPFREQKQKMEQGRAYLVYVYIDELTHRIVASAKIERHLKPASPAVYHRGSEVSLLVGRHTPLGFQVIVDNAHAGLVYADQVFGRPPHMGDRISGTVTGIRPDGRLDVSLERIGKGRFRDFADTLLEELEKAGGTLPFGDASDPDDIAERFGVSKKTFKRAVGTLYKKHLVEPLRTEIRLIGR